jgi:hypothetical protein
MKKLLLLSALLIFACSDDDNSNSSSIEGRWNLTLQKVNGIDSNLDSCSLESYMLLSENGSGLYYIYYTDFPDDTQIEPCGLDDTFNVSSTFITNNSFSMTWNYDVDDIEEGTAEINSNILTFLSLYDGDNYETVFTKE